MPTPKRLHSAITLVIFAGVAVASYKFERAYQRWRSDNHPFAAPRDRLKSMNTTYNRKRSNAMEVAELAGALMAEVGRAISARE